jgi:hypothetical protein
MIERLREFLKGGAGKAAAVVVVLAGLLAAIWSARGVMTSEAEELSANRMFVDAETGKPFRYDLSGSSAEIPAPAPSGKKTGYPAESCYWTKDGKPKPEPTYVLLNMWKGSSEPTFCPDCGRLVVGHNPPATEGGKPPPTKDEYAKGNRGSGERR